MTTRRVANSGDGIACVFGADEQKGLVFKGGQNLTNRGSTDVWKLREASEHDNFTRVHIPGNFHRIAARPSLDQVRLVVNLVTEPDMNPKVLQYADQFLKPFPGIILNAPRQVMKTGRDHIASLLAGIDGLIVPKVVRFRGHPNLANAAIDKGDMRFPAILREIGKHNGDVIGLVADREALLAHLDRRLHYFLTEFVETRAENGLYHKIRVYFFGQRPVIRHRLVSDEWSVHGPDRTRVLVDHPDQIAEERRLIEGGLAALPPIAAAALLAIRARMPLDFFGVDFSLLPDGRVLLFEANATMNFFSLSDDPPFEYMADVLVQAQNAFNAMLADPAG